MKYLLMLLALVSLVQAKEIELCKITTDNNDTIATLGISFEQDDFISGMYVISCSGLGVCQNYYYQADQLQQGIVVEKDAGFDVVTIFEGSNFSMSEGGDLLIEYLDNGISERYESFEIELVKTGRDRWRLQTVDGIAIRSLYFKARKFLGIAIGIKQIIVNK